MHVVGCISLLWCLLVMIFLSLSNGHRAQSGYSQQTFTVPSQYHLQEVVTRQRTELLTTTYKPTSQPSFLPKHSSPTGGPSPVTIPTVMPSFYQSPSTSFGLDTSSFRRLLSQRYAESNGTALSRLAKLIVVVDSFAQHCYKQLLASSAPDWPVELATPFISLTVIRLSPASQSLMVKLNESDGYVKGVFVSLFRGYSSDSSTPFISLVLVSMQLLRSVVNYSLPENITNYDTHHLPVLVSDVLIIQPLSSYSFHQAPFNASFTIRDVAVRNMSTAEHSKPAVLRHNCTRGVRESIALYCLDAGRFLRLECSGQTTMAVIVPCPKVRTICARMDYRNGSIVDDDYCTSRAESGIVQCHCGRNSSAPYNAEMSASSFSITSDTERVTVGAFSQVVAGDFVVHRIPTSLTGNAETSSCIVAVVLACVWTMGVVVAAVAMFPLAVPMCRSSPCTRTALRPEAANGIFSENLPKQSPSTLKRHEADGQIERVAQYLYALLPPSLVPPSQRGRKRRVFWRLLARQHVHARILWQLIKLIGGVRATVRRHSRRNAHHRRQLVVDIVHLVTVLTVSCFVITALYARHTPRDTDDFCAAQSASHDTCILQKRLLDPWASRCRWVGDTATAVGHSVLVESSSDGEVMRTVYLDEVLGGASTADSARCVAHPSGVSVVAFVLCFLIASIVSAASSSILNGLLRYLVMPKGREVSSKLLLDAEATSSSVDWTCQGTQRRPEVFWCDLDAVTVSRARLKWLRRRALFSSSVLESDSPSEIDMDEHLLDAIGNDSGAAAMAQRQLLTQALSFSAVTPLEVAVLLLHSWLADIFVAPATGGPVEMRTAQRRLFLQLIQQTFSPRPQRSSSWVLSTGLVVGLVLGNAGLWYAVVVIVQSRDLHWQMAIVSACMSVWVAEALVAVPAEVWVNARLLPLAIAKDVQMAVSALSQAAVVSSVMDHGNGGSAVCSRPTSPSATLSSLLAQVFPTLPEARWISLSPLIVPTPRSAVVARIICAVSLVSPWMRRLVVRLGMAGGLAVGLLAYDRLVSSWLEATWPRSMLHKATGFILFLAVMTFVIAIGRRRLAWCCCRGKRLIPNNAISAADRDEEEAQACGPVSNLIDVVVSVKDTSDVVEVASDSDNGSGIDEEALEESWSSLSLPLSASSSSLESMQSSVALSSFPLSLSASQVSLTPRSSSVWSRMTSSSSWVLSSPSLSQKTVPPDDEECPTDCSDDDSDSDFDSAEAVDKFVMI